MQAWGWGELQHLSSAPWVPEDKGPLPFCGWVRTCVGLWLDCGKKLPLSLQLHVSPGTLTLRQIFFVKGWVSHSGPKYRDPELRLGLVCL